MTESRSLPDAPVPASSTLRRAWRAPAVDELAPLSALTLQSPILGGEGGFSWLDRSNPTSRLG